jgi:hypothetical protein
MNPSNMTSRSVKAGPVLALAASFVLFGFLYMLAVRPERAGAQAAREKLSSLRRQELTRAQGLSRRTLPAERSATVAPAGQEFDRRIPEEDKASDVADAITRLAKGPAVGGVTNLSIDLGAPEGRAIDPRITLFQTAIAYTPITVGFEAKYVQIERFFWNLRTLPATFELGSVELSPSKFPLMRAKVVLFVLRRATAPPLAPAPTPPVLQTVDVARVPERHRDPVAVQPAPPKELAEAADRAPDPTVESILFSASRRMALVDGRIVKPGDRVGSLYVRDIERDGLVLVTANGLARRIELDHPTIRIGRQ